MTTMDLDLYIEDHFIEVCGVSDVLATNRNGDMVITTIIRYSTVESILTGEVALRAHLYEWCYDTIQETTSLNFHEVL